MIDKLVVRDPRSNKRELMVRTEYSTAGKVISCLTIVP